MIAYQQAKGLAAKGHQVALIAPDGSSCPGVTILPVGAAGQTSEEMAYGGYKEAKQGETVIRRSHQGYWQILPQFDVICDHSWHKFAYSLKMEGKLKTPVLGWCHAPVDTMFKTLPPVEKPCLVCISEDQRQHFEALFGRPARTCYNGCFHGSTLIYPEGGSPERIDQFVTRGDGRRVLSWNSGRLVYTTVQARMCLSPTNLYAIKLVTRTGLKLISTPDNPIMTSRGWVPADEINVGDEVSSGSDLETTREAICVGSLREGDGATNCTGIEQTSIFGLQCSNSIGDGTDSSSHSLLVGRFTGCNSDSQFCRSHGRRANVSAIGTHRQGNTRPCSVVGSEEEQDCLASQDREEASRIDPNGCSLSGGHYRRRGIDYDQSGRQEICTQSVFGSQQHGLSNHQKTDGTASDPVMARGTSFKQRSGEEPPTDLASQHGGLGYWQGSGADYPILDGQESKSGSRQGVLRHSFEPRLEEQIQHSPDRVIPVRKAGELTTWDEVVSVERVPTPSQVFDLQTSTGNFLANGIVVHNCDLDFYKPLGLPRSNRFLFLARFSSIKGPDLAIEACKKAGVGLDLVGDTKLTGEAEYLQSILGQADGKQIRFVGPATRGECVHWFSQAHCLLHPNKTFREPFGLAPVEAMACGCPVIAWNYGAMRETIGKEVGALVTSMEELVEQIKRTQAMSVTDQTYVRQRCREWSSRFSVENMVQKVEELCQEALAGGW